MDLDPQIAETIVENIKDVIKHEINLFDTTGTIIASTDRSRIGTGHDGARKAIATKQTVVIDEDHYYSGAKHGINVPVVFNDSVVAVIGITGKRSEVEPYGNVLKKMTEILIRENWEQMTRFDQRSRLADMVNILKLRGHDETLVNYYASLLRINLDTPRFAVVGHIERTHEESPEGNSLHTSLYIRFQQFKTSFFALSDREVCMFIDERSERDLNYLLKGIREDVEQIVDSPVHFGIGDVQKTSKDYWRSYDKACRALDWLEFLRSDEDSLRYADMDMGLVVSSVPRDVAQQLVNHVFGDLPASEVDEYQKIFDAYTRHNGSIVHCAEELYLHKNTLQNRLNKIANKTGYNPRVLSDYSVLALAFLLRQHTQEQ